MTLTGWTLPQTPSGHTATLTPPPWHYSGEIIAVDFTADPDHVAALAPTGFDPTGDGSCTLFFADWSSAADNDPRIKADPARGQYHEAYIVLTGTFDGRPAGRVPHIWVDSELSLIRGLVQGFPKKLGQVSMTKPVELGKGGSKKAPGETFAAHVSAMNRRLASVSITIEAQSTNARPAGLRPLIHTRLWPSLDQPSPAVHELSIVKVEDFEVGTVWTGTAQLEFGQSEFDEIHLLAPTSIGLGYIYSSAFTATGGTTIALES